MNYGQSQRLAAAMAQYQPVQNGGLAGALAQGLAGFTGGYAGGQAQMQKDKISKSLAEAWAAGDMQKAMGIAMSSGIPELESMAMKTQMEMAQEKTKASELAKAWDGYKGGNMAGLLSVPGGLDTAVKLKALEGKPNDNYKAAGGAIFDTDKKEWITPPAGAINPETGQPERKLSATEQKELFDTMDLTSSSEGAISALTRAKDILTSSPEGAEPYTGVGAELRAGAARLPVVGDIVADKKRGAATTEYKTLVTEQALNNLKAIFGGMPTEGERAILMQMQALPDYTPQEQSRIIDNAITAANKRLEFNAGKADAIRTGQYSQMGKKKAPEQPSGGAPAVGTIEDGYRFKGGNPADPNSWEAAQ